MGFFVPVDAVPVGMSTQSSKAVSGPRRIEFHTNLGDAKVFESEGIIKGVCVITSGVKARGHDLEVDDTTLSQIKTCAEDLGTVAVKWNHKTGADAVSGYLQDFRIDGGKLLADWHLLHNHSQFGHAIEMAKRMPRNVGLSAAFMGADEAKREGGKLKKFARCTELISVDLVANPAANPTGLFEAVVDSKTIANGMETNSQLNEGATEPTMAEVLNELKAMREEVAALREGQGQEQQDGPLSIEQVLALSPEEVDQLVESGAISPDDAQEIYAIHQQIEAEEAEGEAEGEGEGEGETAGAGVAAGGEGTALGALQMQVRELSRKLEVKEFASEQDEYQHLLGTIEGNLTELAIENAEIRESHGVLELECKALRKAVRTGVRPMAFSAGENGGPLTTDGQLHEFQVLVQKHVAAGKTEAQAIRLAHKENPTAHVNYLETLS